ncbi:MAG: insulinase family protein [Candidatus Pacebacteria bacterium]|nr:insulinase family protein [Candidatus Paceibacterota bacterium]
MLGYQKTVLENGLTLLTVPMRGVSSVTVLVGVGAGSRHESASKAGLSHFLEHMALKGTRKRPTPFEVASVIDAIGGESNAGTAKEFTEYWAKVDAGHLEIAFDLLADNLKEPLFKPEQIEKERRVIIEEINMYQDLPMRRVLDVFELLLYGSNPLGRDIAGDKETVSRIRRADFLDHLKKFYQPQKMAVVVAGRFHARRVRRLAKLYFSDLKKSRGSKISGKLPPQHQPRAELVYKKTDQAHFCLGVPGPSYSHPDRFAVSVTASILGYSRTSRIYRRIREERGWAYYVQTTPEYYTDAGSIYTQAGVSLNKINDSIRLILAEYRRLQKEKVSSKELQRAKDYIRGRFILALEDSFNVASRYALQVVVENKIRTPEETLKLIDAVTVDDVRRVARRFFRPEKYNLAVIGPYQKKAAFQKLFKN